MGDKKKPRIRDNWLELHDASMEGREEPPGLSAEDFMGAEWYRPNFHEPPYDGSRWHGFHLWEAEKAAMEDKVAAKEERRRNRWKRGGK